MIDPMLKQPRKLFLIDGLGALLSAFLLGIVLVKLQHLIGVPTRTLYVLAFLPVLFAVYDFLCFFKLQNGFAIYIKYIAVANIMYCLFSIAMMASHGDTLTSLGWFYFIVEILIVGVISLIELKVAKELRKG